MAVFKVLFFCLLTKFYKIYIRGTFKVNFEFMKWYTADKYAYKPGFIKNFCGLVDLTWALQYV